MKIEFSRTQFIKDLKTEDNLKRNYNMGLWNLNLSIRDLKLYSKGIKPNRHWKITPLKDYFGINGNAKEMLSTLLTLKKVLKTKGYTQ
tara:strand:- start:187 stop:450 length:264 start_codon:yes stop_codon:yes gene_type:complete